MAVLDKELETYNAHLADLLPREGKFVLIHDSQVIGTFEGYEDALRAGYKQFGTQPFLVKKIEAVEQAHFCHVPR